MHTPGPRLSAPCARAFACLLGVLWLMATVAISDSSAAQTSFLDSPDGRIRVSIHLPNPSSTNRPLWSATFRGKPILTDCALGLQTADLGDLMAGVQVRRQHAQFTNKRIPVLF